LDLWSWVIVYIFTYKATYHTNTLDYLRKDIFIPDPKQRQSNNNDSHFSMTLRLCANWQGSQYQYQFHLKKQISFVLKSYTIHRGLSLPDFNWSLSLATSGIVGIGFKSGWNPFPGSDINTTCDVPSSLIYVTLHHWLRDAASLIMWRYIIDYVMLHHWLCDATSLITWCCIIDYVTLHHWLRDATSLITWCYIIIAK